MYKLLLNNSLKLVLRKTVLRNLVVQFMLETPKLQSEVDKNSHLWTMKVMMVEL